MQAHGQRTHSTFLPNVPDYTADHWLVASAVLAHHALSPDGPIAADGLRGCPVQACWTETMGDSDPADQHRGALR